jgi:hypothetical protein
MKVRTGSKPVHRLTRSRIRAKTGTSRDENGFRWYKKRPHGQLGELPCQRMVFNGKKAEQPLASAWKLPALLHRFHMPNCAVAWLAGSPIESLSFVRMPCWFVGA